MRDPGFTIFDTPVGPCGIAWNEHGVIGVQLPEEDAAATRARLARRFPYCMEGSAPDDVRAAIDRIRALLDGARDDLASIALDFSAVTPFEKMVYDVARTIRPGETRTYGDVAKTLGVPRAAREVGVALARNPFPIIVPCHRVVAANGKTGGFSGNGGVKTKLRLLGLEGGGGPLFDGF